MCGHRGRRTKGAALLLVVLLATGCAANPAPRGWLPAADQAQREAWGGWAWIECRGVRDPCAQGELIAVDDASFHVMVQGALVSVAVSRIERATVAGYRT